LDLPTRAELEKYIGQVATALSRKLTGIKVDPKAVPALARACTGLTLDETRSIVALALVRYQKIGADAVKLAITEKKQIVERSGILLYEEPEKGLAEVGGLHVVKEYIRARTALYQDSAREAGIDTPRGILLLGPPGTGKTMLARAIALEWGLPLVRLDAGRLFGSYVGQSEGNLRMALKTAEAIAPCVVFVDEVDKAFGGDNQGGDSGTSARVFGALLTWMQDRKADCYIAATCNAVQHVKPEMIARFDDVFFVDLPSEAARAEIFAIHLRDRKGGQLFTQSEHEQFAGASAGYVGREIEKISQNARIAAFNMKRAPVVSDVLAAIKAKVPISLTMENQIKALRQWAASGRAIYAGETIEQDAAQGRAESEHGLPVETEAFPARQ
jgi:SpoVK/Ycf46/Vps4 family AAA+-type ATPase